MRGRTACVFDRIGVEIPLWLGLELKLELKLELSAVPAGSGPRDLAKRRSRVVSDSNAIQTARGPLTHYSTMHRSEELAHCRISQGYLYFHLQ